MSEYYGIITGLILVILPMGAIMWAVLRGAAIEQRLHEAELEQARREEEEQGQ
jgi:hypothetical protein